LATGAGFLEAGLAFLTAVAVLVVLPALTAADPFLAAAADETFFLSDATEPLFPDVAPDPDERVPDDRVPDDRVPDDRVPDDRVPDDRVSDDRVPDEFCVLGMV
jgi:hypothetical protein